MKNSLKFLSALAVSLLCFTFVACSDDETKEPDQLPTMAQVFIGDYFGDGSIKSVTYDKKDKDWEVKLYNGFELKFDEQGNWTLVDAPTGQVIPDGIAPEPIASYVVANYPQEGITEIEKTKSQYEVELTNGYELYFSLAGEFQKVDMN